MAEHPILFNSQMIKAVLAERKTQTRRVIKGNISHYNHFYYANASMCHGVTFGYKVQDKGWTSTPIIRCPYGTIGDRLWVRETFAYDWEHERYFYKADADSDGSVPYLVNGDGGLGGGVGHAKIYKWKPSIHMPRKACRIQLEITDIRVEQIRNISAMDAVAEGIERSEASTVGARAANEIGTFKRLWDSINDKRGFGWHKNPWVWVVEFKVIA